MLHSTTHALRSTLHGTVIHGQGIGKKLGLPPTMNVQIFDMPASLEHGIYAVGVRRTDRAVQAFLKGVAHYGPRPAVNAPLSFEIHVFDFNEDWYGTKIEVRLGGYIRAVEDFSSTDALRQQIEKDIEAAKRILR